MKFHLPQLVFAVMCAVVLNATGVCGQDATGREQARVSVAVLDLGETDAGLRVANELSAALARQTTRLGVVNRAQSRAAARGVGYAGSLNLTLEEARSLGASVGCDFYFTGEAQTLRRTSTARGDYFESYASLFLVSTETGRLVLWEHVNAESDAGAADEAEKRLLAHLRERAARYVDVITQARAAENAERLASRRADVEAGAFEELPEEGSPAAVNFRAPQPYRSLRPAYPETAARAAVEATVDALVAVDAAGEVKDIEIVRWAGYGLIEAVTATVRQLHFRPAMRDGRPVPVRVLLRYNFRRPADEAKGKG
ncbi:MAG TPA: energy transducer TonB [Pyrinomonadaceae bacterium]|jgi:TonB family protein